MATEILRFMPRTQSKTRDQPKAQKDRGKFWVPRERLFPNLMSEFSKHQFNILNMGKNSNL